MTWERFAADRAKQDAEMERLRAALAKEQREHANCEDMNAKRFQVLTDAIIDLTQQITAMRPVVEAIVAAQDTVKSAEMRWHQVTRTDSYPESEVRKADREWVMALRARDEAIEQARAFLASGQAAAE